MVPAPKKGYRKGAQPQTVYKINKTKAEREGKEGVNSYAQSKTKTKEGKRLLFPV